MAFSFYCWYHFDFLPMYRGWGHGYNFSGCLKNIHAWLACSGGAANRPVRCVRNHVYFARPIWCSLAWKLTPSYLVFGGLGIAGPSIIILFKNSVLRVFETSNSSLSVQIFIWYPNIESKCSYSQSGRAQHLSRSSSPHSTASFSTHAMQSHIAVQCSVQPRLIAIDPRW